MMYKVVTISDSLIGKTSEHILCNLSDGGVQSFPNVETNMGPERAAFLEWLSEGNTPEPWNPDTP